MKSRFDKLTYDELKTLQDVLRKTLQPPPLPPRRSSSLKPPIPKRTSSLKLNQ